jgi:pepF/M3 family oligoendopeptidase
MKEGIIMNSEWSLDIFYTSYQDPKFTEDFKRYDESIVKIKEYVSKLSNIDKEEALVTILGLLEEHIIIESNLGSYIALRQSTNTSDTETVSNMSVLEKKSTELSKEMAMIDKYIASVENLDELIEKNEKLKGYSFLLKTTKENAKYFLSDDVEEVIAKMNLSAGSAWGNLQEYLTSTLEVDYNGEKTTLSGIRNLAYDNDANVRKEAYYAELAGYDKIKDSVAFAINNIKKQVNTISDLRGYESPLHMTLRQARMSKETLDAMIIAMKEYFPKFQEYLKRKAELLGHKNGLPWYDLFALLGENNRKFTTEEAKDYLINHFKGFADDLAEMVEEAFDNSWIDFFPHKGKVGGAFCANLPHLKQSRVLSNFEGSLSDVVTLAHELGHAYHGLNIQDHLPLNYEYSMPVAETASTFNETVIMTAAIEEAKGKDKMVLIESQLQDVTQIICDIYSRYLFESDVFEKSKTGFMFADELKEMMNKAQKEAFGDAIQEDTLHPFMWLCKGHYYSSSLSFYNFPYAFGGLFARGLYALYQKEGKDFLPKYRSLLHATTVNTVEDVAKMAGIDLTKPDFWRESLQSFSDQIDQFIELSK